MTREDHLAKCRWCRNSVNCIEWYRHGLAGCWCDACGTDHWVTWEGELQPLDTVTITWWSSWGMVASNQLASTTVLTPFGPPLSRGVRVEHVFAREAVLPPETEGITWMRGVFLCGDEVAALLAAKALA